MVEFPNKILNMVLNRLTILPCLEVAGIFDAKDEDSITSTVLNALNSQQATYGDLDDFILHFILIGYEFYDRRDDDRLHDNFILGLKSFGVEKALLTIYSMCRREIISHKDFEKLYPTEPTPWNYTDEFGTIWNNDDVSLPYNPRKIMGFPDKLSINDELDHFFIRQLENKYIVNEPRIFTFHTTKMIQNEKDLINNMNQDFLESFVSTQVGIHPVLKLWDVSQQSTVEGKAINKIMSLSEFVFWPITDLQRQPKYILYACARKSFLLPSDEASLPGLTKIDFDYSDPMYRRAIYEPFEKILGTRWNIHISMATKSPYPYRILDNPELELPHWRPYLPLE